MYFSLYFVNMLQVYRFLLLSCAISSSHGVKLNVQGQLSVGRNAADFLSKVLQNYKGSDTPKDPGRNQSVEDTDIKPQVHIVAREATDVSKRETKNVQRNPEIPPWYVWYPWLYDEYKKHKHGHNHKHHKKHHHHSYEYYYSSYEDDNKKHLVIIPGNDEGNKKHMVIVPERNEGENKKHMIVNPGDDGGNKKHVVVRPWRDGEKKKQIVYSSGRNENGKHVAVPLLGLVANWHNHKYEDEQNKPRQGTGGKHSQASEGNQHWKSPQFGSEENKKWKHQWNGDKEVTTNRPGILRQLWDMYKSIRDNRETNRG